MENLLKNELRVVAIQTREKHGFTQAKMADFLVMATRSYADIEDGVNMCGTLTAILLLIDMDNRELFLDDLQRKLEELYQHGAIYYK